MMPCTRMYVESTEKMIGQVSKRRLLIHLNQGVDNIRGNNSFFIIIT